MKKTNSRKIGLVIFWIGTVYLFVMSWAFMWWLTAKMAQNPQKQI